MKMLMLEGASKVNELIIPDEECGEVLAECDECHARFWLLVIWGCDDFYHLAKGQYVHCGKGRLWPVEPWQIREQTLPRLKQTP